MIVCSYNVFVRSFVNKPVSVRTVSNVYRGLECRPKCGRCAHSIRQIINESDVSECACSA
jgi:bacterioferritin-associated ferredoxin